MPLEVIRPWCERFHDFPGSLGVGEIEIGNHLLKGACSREASMGCAEENENFNRIKHPLVLEAIVSHFTADESLR